ncbi:MAG TPA: CoA transferase [Dehalococcoidia bacterium]|jgi:crotonobetainyl-CoA:carnitine CoA-transferase CaiB-like acyl-CoA transferase|nr:CoA transferase [Dehalococcoidia bacterium]
MASQAPQGSRNGNGSQPSPLDGLRVVDLSMFMSGPMATQILGDGGAEIIKVESVQRIDGWRGAAGSQDVERPWELSPNYNWVNRSKRGITLNLTDPRGADLLKRLVTISDVVIENYTPRVMDNFGLGYEVLREITPDLIMLSMPGFGQAVSWRDYVAFGMSTEQMSGISHLTGYDDGPPMFTGTNGGDPFVGVIAASALLAAINHRKRTGEGQHMDLSQIEACTMYIGDVLTDWAVTGDDPGRISNHHPSMAPHGIYPCADDGWIAVACQSDEEWRSLAACLGRSELAEDGSPFATAAGRLAASEQLDEAISAWTAPQGHLALMHSLQAAGVTAGAVMNGPQLLDDAHMQARAALIPQDRPNLGIKHYPGQPYRFAKAAMVENRRAPLLGEHTNEVLKELLDLGDEELDALEADDITGTTPIAARS